MEIQSLYYRDWDNSFVPHILKEIYLDRVYDRFFLGRKDLVVLDLGANIGLFSVYASQFAKKIIAVEPDPEHCEVLEKNLAQTGVDYQIIQKAVALLPGKKTFYRNPSNTTANTLIGGSPEHGFEVTVIKIDSLFDEVGLDVVDFMKLDIEGSEFEVVGGVEFDLVAPKIQTIVGEMHMWARRNFNQMKDALVTRGFSYSLLKSDASLFAGEKL